jgi:hypothetical protein
MPQHRSQKRRAILTELQASEKFTVRSASTMSMILSSPSVLAKRYGINERTVRDIWMQCTWTHATCSLAANAGPMAKRKMGRPVGAKNLRRNFISSDSSTPSIPLKCDAMRPFSKSCPGSDFHEQHVDSDSFSASKRDMAAALQPPARRILRRVSSTSRQFTELHSGH